MPIRKLPGAAPTATPPLGAVQTFLPPTLLLLGFLLLVSSHQVPGGGHRLRWASFQPGLSQILMPGGTSLSEVLGCISGHWGQVLLADRKISRMLKMEIPPHHAPHAKSPSWGQYTDLICLCQELQPDVHASTSTGAQGPSCQA